MIIRSICDDVINECRQEAEEEEARRLATLSMLRRRAESDVTDAILAEVVAEEVRDVTTQHVRELQVRTLLERLAHEEREHVIADVTREESLRVIDDVYQTDVIDRLQQLHASSAGVQLLRTARYWSKWRNNFAARIRLKRSMLNFPATPSLLSPGEQVRRLLPASVRVERGCMTLGAKRSRLTLHSPVDVIKDRKKWETNV